MAPAAMVELFRKILVVDRSVAKKNRMAKEAGLSVNAVNGIHDNFWNPTFRTLNKLEAYLIQKGYADD